MTDTTRRPTARTFSPLRLGAVAGWVLATVVLGLTLGTYHTGIGANVAIMALLALGMVLVTGYAGQFSLATGAFYGIGAYGSALLTAKLGLPALVALIGAAAVAGIVAWLLGSPVFRLRGHFLAMATLALTEIFYLVVNNATITGGSSGLGVAPLTFGPVTLMDTSQHFILNWLIVGAAVWAAHNLGRSREGRALKAIRGHETAAASAGIDIRSSKTRIFVASAILGSLAGSLYAHQIMYVNPPPFGVHTVISVLALAVLGGLRSPWGAVIGALLIEALSQGIEWVVTQLWGSGAAGAGESLFFGLMLVLILIFRPEGAVGLIKYVWGKVRPPVTPAAVEDKSHDGVDMATMRRREDEEFGEPAVGAEVLSAQGLTKRFGGVVAVNDVTLDLHAGEVLAVIGPNGAGKSTLVNLLSGNLTPTTGTITMNGQDVTTAPAHVMARQGLARTFQTPCLFEDMSVIDTVKVGAHLQGSVGMTRASVPTRGSVKEEEVLHDETLAALRRLELDHLGHLDARSLSLGQQKQIEIARALVARPKALLLDEPCAGLNKLEKRQLMRLLRQLGREGLAVLVIEHDMEFVMSSADRVQVINFGSTLRVGRPDEVQADQAVIDAYLGVPSTDADDEADADAPATGGAR